MDLYLHSPVCLHGIYRDGFTSCRPTSVRYMDLPKFRIYTNIYDLVRYPCVESDRKRVEWAAIPLCVEKLSRQFVGWELVLLEAVCQQANMTHGQTVGQVQHALHSVGVVGRFRAGGGGGIE